MIRSEKHKEESKEKNRLWHLGKKQSKETVRKRIETRKRNSKQKGYWHSNVSIQKMSKNHFGKRNSQESYQKGVITRRKNAELRGYWCSQESNIKRSESLMGIKNHNYGKYFKKETIQKMRLSAIKRIQENNGICPSYNKSFCELLDKKLHTLSDYACNRRNGERLLKSLGYFPDYFNEKLKLMIECDEKHHFNKDGSLKERDIVRQNEIKKAYSDFLFVRINAETKKITIVE